MEKTLARAIYKKMEINKEYTTNDLVRIIGDEYYDYITMIDWHTQENGKSVMQTVSDEMWKIVKAGYAKTYKSSETLANVRGLRFGQKPTSYTTYDFRYWVRTR